MKNYKCLCLENNALVGKVITQPIRASYNNLGVK